MNNFWVPFLTVSSMTLGKKRLNRQHLIVMCSLLGKEMTIGSQALIHCGDSRVAFIDKNFIYQYNFLLLK